MAREVGESVTPVAGLELRAAREARGLGQGQLERMLGLKKSTLRYQEQRGDLPVAEAYRALAQWLRSELPVDQIAGRFEEAHRSAAARLARRLEILDHEAAIHFNDHLQAETIAVRVHLRALDNDCRGLPIGVCPIPDAPTEATVDVSEGGSFGREQLDRWNQEYYVRFDRPLGRGDVHTVSYALTPPLRESEYLVYSSELARLRRMQIRAWLPLDKRDDLFINSIRRVPAHHTPGDARSSRRVHPTRNGLVFARFGEPRLGEGCGFTWRTMTENR